MISSYGIEHWDNFGDSIIFWCVAGDVPKKYIDKAVQIDKENYSSDCFGACVIFDVDGFHMCQDSPDCELYYIDNDGDKHWFEKVFTDEEAKTFFEECFEEITANLPQ